MIMTHTKARYRDIVRRDLTHVGIKPSMSTVIAKSQTLLVITSNRFALVIRILKQSEVRNPSGTSHIFFSKLNQNSMLCHLRMCASILPTRMEV